MNFRSDIAEGFKLSGSQVKTPSPIQLTLLGMFFATEISLHHSSSG